MKTIDWTDDQGRKHRVQLPDDADESEAALGIPVGPPPVVDLLGLPEEVATRLHNQLHARGLWGLKEALRDAPSVFGALQAALKIDAQGILAAYKQWEQSAGPEAEEHPRNARTARKAATGGPK